MLNEFGQVVNDVVFQARRKTLGQLIHGRFDVRGGGQRIRSRPLEDADCDRRISIEIGIGRIVLGRKLDGRDIFHPHHGGCRLLDDDVAELLGTRQASQGLHRNLNAPGLSTGG